VGNNIPDLKANIVFDYTVKLIFIKIANKNKIFYLRYILITLEGSVQKVTSAIFDLLVFNVKFIFGKILQLLLIFCKFYPSFLLIKIEGIWTG
jgi:hypothetical protein